MSQLKLRPPRVLPRRGDFLRCAQDGIHCSGLGGAGAEGAEGADLSDMVLSAPGVEGGKLLQGCRTIGAPVTFAAETDADKIARELERRVAEL
jgi:hypothetical protein